MHLAREMCTCQQGGDGRSRLYDSDEEMAAPDPYRSEVVIGPDNGGYEDAGEETGAAELYGAMGAYNGYGQQRSVSPISYLTYHSKHVDQLACVVLELTWDS